MFSRVDVGRSQGFAVLAAVGALVLWWSLFDARVAPAVAVALSVGLVALGAYVAPTQFCNDVLSRLMFGVFLVACPPIAVLSALALSVRQANGNSRSDSAQGHFGQDRSDSHRPVPMTTRPPRVTVPPRNGTADHLLHLRARPSDEAAPTLRNALSSHDDEARLVAFSMLTTREKSLRAQINAAENEMRRSERPPARMHQLLAESYLELVDLGLGSEEQLRLALEAAEQHCDAAKAIRGETLTVSSMVDAIQVRKARATNALN